MFRWEFEQAEKSGEDELQAARRMNIPVVGETYDGLLNDISASAIDEYDVYDAIWASKRQDDILEGNHGGGTAMRCHGYKGGTGTSSRIIPGIERDYTLGVLVQANHGQKQDLRIGNVPVGEILAREDAGAGQVKLPAAGRAAEGSRYSRYHGKHLY